MRDRSNPSNISRKAERTAEESVSHKMFDKSVQESTEKLLENRCINSNRNVSEHPVNYGTVSKQKDKKSTLQSSTKSCIPIHKMCDKSAHESTEKLLENRCINSNRYVSEHPVNYGKVSKPKDKKRTPQSSTKSRIPIRDRSINSNRLRKNECVADGGVVQKMSEGIMPEAKQELLDGTCSHSNRNTAKDKKNTLVASTKSRIPRPTQVNLSSISRKTERTAKDTHSAK
jgi:hypothetical protein